MLTQMKLAALKAFSIFGVDIYWYGIIIVSGMAVAIAFGCYLTKYRKTITAENVLDASLFVIPLGVLGARLFYVLSDGESWTLLEFFTRPGGLSILGGVIGGALGVFLASAIKKLDSLSLRDVIVPCVLLAQAIGRWGNFLNQEVYGYPVTDPAWQWFPFAVNINGTYHHALFFYEFLANLAGAILLFLLLRKVKIKGVVGFAYFLWYGFWRAILEGLRMEEYILGIDEFMASRAVSIVFAIIGIVGIIYLILNDKKKKTLALAGTSVGASKGTNENFLYKNNAQAISNGCGEGVNEKEQKPEILTEATTETTDSTPTQSEQQTEQQNEKTEPQTEQQAEPQNEQGEAAPVQDAHKTKPSHIQAEPDKSPTISEHDTEQITQAPIQNEPKTKAHKIASLVAELDEFDREIEQLECDIASIEEAITIEPNTLSEGDIARLSKELDDIERSLITVRSASSIKKKKTQVKKETKKTATATKKHSATKSSTTKSPSPAKTPTTAKKTTKTKKTTPEPPTKQK